MKKDIETVKETVQVLLMTDKRCRNDDKYLIFQVLKRWGCDIKIPDEILEGLPIFESITRARRKFQEDGFFMADEKTKILREKEENEMHKMGEWW